MPKLQHSIMLECPTYFQICIAKFSDTSAKPQLRIHLYVHTYML